MVVIISPQNMRDKVRHEESVYPPRELHLKTFSHSFKCEQVFGPREATGPLRREVCVFWVWVATPRLPHFHS